MTTNHDHSDMIAPLSGIGVLSCLPPEIQLKIYRYLFVQSQVSLSQHLAKRDGSLSNIVLKDHHYECDFEASDSSSDDISDDEQDCSPRASEIERRRAVVKHRTAILTANKTIYNEAVPILYEQPVRLPETDTLHTFLRTIGPSNVMHLRHIALALVWTGTENTVAAFALLASNASLRHLFIGKYASRPERTDFLSDLVDYDALDEAVYEDLGGLLRSISDRNNDSLSVVKLSRKQFRKYSFGGREVGTLARRELFEKKLRNRILHLRVDASVNE